MKKDPRERRTSRNKIRFKKEPRGVSRLKSFNRSRRPYDRLSLSRSASLLFFRFCSRLPSTTFALSAIR
jgi:hypothetical protein